LNHKKIIPIPGVTPPPKTEDDPAICKAVISKITTSGAYYKDLLDKIKVETATYTVHSEVYNGYHVNINLRLDIPPVVSGERATIGDGHWGLVAFYPVPSIATLNCRVEKNEATPLTPPAVVNLYLESHFVDPKRDFLTNPQNTFTFNAGFITAHKYVAQSPAKTVVDTITAPVRALMPSVTVSTNTAVTTGGGKPDQTTTTTSTSDSPSKGP